MGLPAIRNDRDRDDDGAAKDEVALLSAALGPDFDVAMMCALLNRFGGISGLARAGIDQLDRIIGDSKRVERLYAVLDIAAKINMPDTADHPVIGDCEDLVRHLRQRIGDCRVETFNILFLDTHNRVVADEILWTGTVSEVAIYPREIIRRALELDSSAFIAAHNHPGNIASPSAADVEMTKRLLHAARIMGLVFHDHFIIARHSYHSMRFHQSVTPWTSGSDWR